jgi:hypothetical protein
VSRREAARRRRVKVCDPVFGRVSPNDIRAYLLATGWVLDEKTPFFDRPSQPDIGGIRDPFDGAPADSLATTISDLGDALRRRPGDVLRAIEAHARGEPAVGTLPPRPTITSEDLSDLAEGIAGLRGLPGVRPWSAARLARAVEEIDDPLLSVAASILVEVGRRLRKRRQ